MMINIPYQNPRLETLQTAQKVFYTETAQKHNFPNEESKGLLIEREENFLKSILEGRKNLSESIIGFQRLSYIYMQYLQYLLITKEDASEIEDILATSAVYNVFALKLRTQKECFTEHNKVTSQENMTYALSLLLLLDEESSESIMQTILSDIEEKNYLIYNDENIIISPLWFLLSFYTKTIKSNFNLSTLQVENVSYPYDDMLKEWDSEDMSKVSLWVYLLCEVHIELTRDNECYSNTLTQLFPFEVLVWLKLREKADLQNPTEFVHPLMNTPIAKMFLDIKEPLPKPTELPYAKELLENLQEQCPDVEVPEWFDGENTSQAKVNKETSDNILPDDFMK